jgi:hypothetical protein
MLTGFFFYSIWLGQGMCFSAKPSLLGCVAVLVALGLSLLSSAQNPATSPGIYSSEQLDAEREKIWNSPEMIEARAHVETTLKRSAKITDEQTAKYMADLKAMSADDMQIWLIQHQEQRARVQREEAQAAGMRRGAVQANMPAQNVGNFRNPVAPTGRPAGSGQRSAPTFGGSQRTQRPFSGRQYSPANRPLVTSQEMARFEILRGPRPW